jgi:hypothetical protein
MHAMANPRQTPVVALAIRPVSGFLFTLMPPYLVIGNAKGFVFTYFSSEYN